MRRAAFAAFQAKASNLADLSLVTREFRLNFALELGLPMNWGHSTCFAPDDQYLNNSDVIQLAERDYIRRELDMFFSTFPLVSEGFHLKAWRAGEHGLEIPPTNN